MYWILNSKSIGLAARQNELIELALTHKFAGFDIDINEFHSQAQGQGLDHAKRFIASAPVKLGAFELPVRWQGEVADFKIDLSNLSAIAETAVNIGSTICYTTVLPYSDQRPYHENFELSRERLAEIGDVLVEHGIRLGVNFLAASHHREGHQETFITKPDEVVTLVKTVGSRAVGVCVDSWNWHVAGGTIEQVKQLEKDHIVLVRIADLPEGADLATVSDKQRLMPGATGVVPNAELIAVLEEKGFEGQISPFCHPSQFSSRNKNTTVLNIAKAIKQLVNPVAAVETKGDGEGIEDEETVAASS